MAYIFNPNDSSSYTFLQAQHSGYYDGAGGGAGNIRQGANWANPGDTGIYQNQQLGRARTTEPGWEQGGGNWNRVIPQWVRTAYGSQYNFGTRDKHGLVIISSEPIS